MLFTCDILKVVKKAKVEILKRKTIKRQILKSITPRIKEEEEEDIKENISKSKSDYVIITSSSVTVRT